MAFEEFIPTQRFRYFEFLHMMKRLFPKGAAWNFKTSPGVADTRTSLLGLLLGCFSTEMERFAADFNTLVREAVPGLSTEALLLTDWERIAGLPDECTESGDTEAQRQLAVHQKIYGEYTGLTEQFYIDYAAGLNVTVTVETSPGGIPFRTTTKGTGDVQRVTRMPASYLPGTPTERIDGSRLNSLSSLYTFTVTVTADPEGNQDVLECIFNKLKPAFAEINFVKI
jgi:uncharacterized protein YmfQ (DUF2313 family)